MPFIGAAFAAIGGAISAVAATTIGSIALNLAVGVGLSALSKALSPKAGAGEPLSGIETSVQIGGDIARQICIGRVAAYGQLVYHNTSGENNESYQQAFVLSDWVSDSAGLEQVIIDGKSQSVTLLGTSGAVSEYRVDGFDDANGNALCLIYWYDGTQTTADPTLVAAANPAGKWDANSILAGMTCAAVMWSYDKDSPLYEGGGIPKIKFVHRGARLYDPRLDSTNGGSGTCRWNDVSTWVWSDNPVIALYNYQRGFYLAGERILGMGVPPYDIDHGAVFAAANICEEQVALDAGGTEDRYRCSIILSADKDVTHATTLEALLSTCAGYLHDYAGTYVVTAGAAQSAVATITDDDLVIGHGVTFAAKRSRADLVNTIHGQCLDPSSNWEPISYTAQVSAGGIANDGEELGRALDLLAVGSRTQAERIAKIRLREVRAQATASIVVGYHLLSVQAGDWIDWDSARYGERTWRIVEREVDPITRAVRLELAEIDTDVYSWSASDEGQAPALPVALVPGNRLSVPLDFTVQADVELGADGRVIPALAFNWLTITDPTVDGVVIQYRKVGTDTAQVAIDQTPGDGELRVFPVAGGVDYEARASIRTTPARAVSWTPWVSVTTHAESVIATLSEQVQARLQQLDPFAQASLAVALADLRAEIERQASANSGSFAAIDWQANRLTSVLGKQVGSAIARITTVEEVTVTEVAALASRITQLFVENEFGNAETMIRFIARAAESGVAARIALEARANSEGVFSLAGMEIDAGVDDLGGLSRIRLRANQIALTDDDGDTPTPIAVFQGGTAYIDNLVARNIGADTVSATQIVLNGVVFDSIAPGAVSNANAAFTAAAQATLQVQAVGITRRPGTRGLLRASFDFAVGDTGGVNLTHVYVALKRNGATLQAQYQTIPARVTTVNGNPTGGWTSTAAFGGRGTIDFVDTGALNGSYTYTLEVAGAAPATSQIVAQSVSNAYLQVLEIK